MKALTVDDSNTVRTMIRNILEPAKYEVFEAENGEEALKVVDDVADIDVILLDWEMPVMDGLTFLQKVRTENLADETKIIMLTTLNKTPRRQRIPSGGRFSSGRSRRLACRRWA